MCKRTCVRGNDSFYLSFGKENKFSQYVVALLIRHVIRNCINISFIDNTYVQVYSCKHEEIWEKLVKNILFYGNSLILEAILYHSDPPQILQPHNLKKGFFLHCNQLSFGCFFTIELCNFTLNFYCSDLDWRLTLNMLVYSLIR